MKRIAICSVDDRAVETADWLVRKLDDINIDYSVLDNRLKDTAKPLTHIIDNLYFETTKSEEVCIHIGTRYDTDLQCIDKQQNLLKITHLIEKLSKKAGHDLGYDMVFIINSDNAVELARDYDHIYNLKTKILPNRPASIIGRQIWKFMKFVPKEEKK